MRHSRRCIAPTISFLRSSTMRKGTFRYSLDHASGLTECVAASLVVATQLPGRCSKRAPEGGQHYCVLARLALIVFACSSAFGARRTSPEETLPTPLERH